MISDLDELDDDALSDGGEDDLTSDQQGMFQCYVFNRLFIPTFRS